MDRTSLSYFSSDSDWERCRPLITRLRQTEGITLKQIQAAVETQFGLKGSDKMYKTKFDKWGLTKYNKRQDIDAILRQKAQRDAVGKKSQFFLRGRLVRLADVERYAKRNKITVDNIQLSNEHAQAHLKGLICCTPPPASPVFRPECFRKVEKFFFDFTAFTEAGLGKGGTEYLSNPGHLSQQEDLGSVWALDENIFQGIAYFKWGRMELAGFHFRRGFSGLDTSITNAGATFLLEVLFLILKLSMTGCLEVARMLRSHVSQIAHVRLPAHDPGQRVYEALATLNEEDTYSILILATKLCHTTLIEHPTGPPESIWKSRRHVAHLLNRLDDHTAISEYRSLLIELEDQYGRLHQIVYGLLLDYAFALTAQSLFDEAEGVLLKLLDRIGEVGPSMVGLEFIALRQLGEVRYESRKVGTGKTTMIKALNVFERNEELKLQDYTPTLYYLYETLWVIAVETEQDEEAAEWRAKRADLDEYFKSLERAERASSQ